jgi:hypothetical protein
MLRICCNELVGGSGDKYVKCYGLRAFLDLGLDPE